MKIFILPEFIEDIKSLDNIRTLGRVLDKLFDGKFEFKTNRDDHRYKGVADAWIRDVSKGSTAYRCIYLQKDDKIYLYRAGTKKIEENLATPNLGVNVIELNEFKVEVGTYIQSQDTGSLLKSPEPQGIFNEILRFSHTALREVWLVSPYISKELFNDTNHFGRFINRALEDKTVITLITQPPKTKEDIDFFDILETKEILVLYKENINARLWYFDIDFEKMSPSLIEAGYVNTAILGSSCLTTRGIAINEDDTANMLELCYKLPVEKNEEFYGYCNYLFKNSTDHSKYKQQLRWA